MSAGESSVNGTNRSRWLTYENGILLLLGTTFGLVWFDRNAMNFLAADVVKDLGLTGAQLGWLSSGLSLAWALSAYFVGAWSDRRGTRKPFVLGSIVIFSLCSALSGLATSFAFLLLARVIMGLAEGPFLPVCLSILNVESSPNRRSLNTGIIQNVFVALLGTMLSGFLIPTLAASFAWRNTFFLTGIPGLACALLVWLYLREPERDKAASAGPAHTVDAGALAMLKVHNIRVCCVISIFMVAWFLVAFVFLPIFFQNYRGFTAEEAGGLVGGTGFATLFGGFFVPAWSDRVGRKPAMIIFCFIGMVTGAAALFFHGPVWMLRVLLFVGWTATGSFPLFMGVVPGEAVSRSLAASSMGLVVGIGEIVGGVAAPPVAGRIADLTSLEAPMIVVLVCAFCAGVAALFLEETAPRKVSAAQGQRVAEYRKAA